MKAFEESLEGAATTCALCHDQCLSACPLVAATRRTAAYPSRLANLVWALARDQLQADGPAARALLYCVDCNACTAQCVYAEAPNDVTPVVRWGRARLAQAGALDPCRLGIGTEAASGRWPGQTGPAGSLLLAGPGEEQAAGAVADLLLAAGWSQLSLVTELDPGRELWRYGFEQAARARARWVAAQIRERTAGRLATVSPAAAGHLQHVYPELEAPLGVAARWWPAVLNRTGLALEPVAERVALVVSDAEAYRGGSRLAQALVEACGGQLPRQGELVLPEGPPLGLVPDPRPRLARELLDRVARQGVERLLVSHSPGLAALRAADPALPVEPLALYVRRHLS